MRGQSSPLPDALSTEHADGPAPPVPALSVSPPRSPPVAPFDGDGDVAASASAFRSPVRIRDDHFGSSKTPESPSEPQVEAGYSPVRQQEWEEHASHSSLAGDTRMAWSLEAAATQRQLTLEEDISGLDTPAQAMELADRIVSQGGVVALERTILPQPGASQPTRTILPKSTTQVTDNSDFDIPEMSPHAIDLSLEAADTPDGSVDSSVGDSADLFVTTAARGDDRESRDSSSGEDTATTESSLVLVDRPESPGMKVHNARQS